MKHYIKLMLVAVLLLNSGCAIHSAGQNSSVTQVSAQERKARKLFLQGSYKQSALIYQRLANAPSARQDFLRLRTAQVLLEMAQDDKAKAYLDLIASNKLNTKQHNLFYLMYARLDLNQGNPELAIKHLKHIKVSTLAQQQKPEYYEMSAFSYALSGQLIRSVRARIELGSYLQTQQKKENNNVAILETLSLVPEQTLAAQKAQHQASVYSGWLALEEIRRQYRGKRFTEALDEWALQYPQHPGQLLIASGYFLISGFQLGDVSNIALLLPESGPYSSHAKALKAGFMAAYEQQPIYGSRPDVRLYDSQQASISAIYQQAVSDGAQLVIGPLNKKYIQQLADSGDLIVPVMALNYVEGLAKTNLYQFALSPIDEVQQAVAQARFSNYENAIILAPKTANGMRISHYFQEAWEEVNGNVIQVQMFDPAAKDFSFPVQQMLSINESQSRFQRLQKVIGTVEYQSRRRQDVDVIFLVASKQQARLINPQFFHNRAGSVAVYGLSQVYAGQIDKNKDMDLEGVSFCTIPWLFDEAYQGELSRLALQDLWQQYPNRDLSLIAFGMDAYTIIAHLNNLATIPHNGATGDLLLNEYNRIERHLRCAKFKSGEVLLVEMADEELTTELNPWQGGAVAE